MLHNEEIYIRLVYEILSNNSYTQGHRQCKFNILAFNMSALVLSVSMITANKLIHVVYRQSNEAAPME